MLMELWPAIAFKENVSHSGARAVGSKVFQLLARIFDATIVGLILSH